MKKKIHYDDDGYYLCNHGLGRYEDFVSEFGRVTKDKTKITCKNCLENLTKHNINSKKDCSNCIIADRCSKAY